jgi:hypothetical protein
MIRFIIVSQQFVKRERLQKTGIIDACMVNVYIFGLSVAGGGAARE